MYVSGLAADAAAASADPIRHWTGEPEAAVAMSTTQLPDPDI